MVKITINIVLTIGILVAAIGCANLSEDNKSLENDDKFSKFSAYTQIYKDTILLEQSHATGHVGNFFFTHWKDGGSASQRLTAKGDFEISWQGGGYNYVGGPGWSAGDRDRIIGYRLDKDSGANYVTLYGWGYDKSMDPKDPAHLVEYYVLQRTIHERGKPNGEYGKTFTSNGVEYRTYRTLRDQKPSINSTETFYQYWSIPTEDLPFGQNHLIIFADHIRAWEATGWVIPNMDNVEASDDPTYQVFAIEVFNPKQDGVASGRIWDASQK